MFLMIPKLARCSSVLTVLALLAATFMNATQARAQASAPADAADAKLSDEELDELVGPIALYPDSLVAQILPASAYPLEIVQAARDLQDNGGTMSEDAINALDYDESILGLMHYPDVIDVLNEDLDWTTTLGDAVVAQQEDVMAAIQRFRARTEAAGNLQTTEQATVTTEGDIIQIAPSDPEVIYVPTYDPEVVVVDDSDADPVIAFGAGLAVGAWLGYACSWDRYRVGVYPGHRHYWAGIRPGWGARPYWGPSPARRSTRRVARRTSRRTTRRTTRRVANRHGNRPGTGHRPAGAAARGTAARRHGGAATTHRAGTGYRGTRNQTYGGYRNHQNARSHSQRGAASRGAAGRSQLGGSRGVARQPQRTNRGAYGGYRSGRTVQRHSARGAHSRGGGHRGGGRRGGRR